MEPLVLNEWDEILLLLDGDNSVCGGEDRNAVVILRNGEAFAFVDSISNGCKDEDVDSGKRRYSSPWTSDRLERLIDLERLRDTERRGDLLLLLMIAA